ncbi:hypothetical protein MY8738_005212 [Beauveria namnaoensis]
MTAKEVTEFENACAARAMVVPRWLPGNNVFWYRRSLPSDKWQFIFVDCARGTAQPAFDHAALATTLSSVNGAAASESLDADQLPLTWLNVDPDGAWVRFRYADKIWQFSRTNALEVWCGQFEEDQFEQDYDITKPSPRTSPGRSSVTIVNLTNVMLGYYWIDHDGNNERRIDQVLPGDSFPFTSPIGYRFRFWEACSGRNVVLELKQERGIVNIEDRREGLGVSWDNGLDVACEPESPQATETVSKPDYETFIRRYNLWMRKDKVETQVSFDGFEDNRYQNASVAPGGRYAVAMQTRQGSRYPLELKNSVPDDQLRPKVLSHHTNKNGWRRAGDHLDTDRPRLFDMHARREMAINDSLFSNPYQIQRIGWSDCGNKFRFIFNERGHKHVRLLEISTDGTVKVLVEDSSDTVVDYNQKLWYKMLPATNEVLWASERDGWNHIYRFDLSDARLKNQVTKGEWVVKSVENVIIKEQRIWFTACGAIPGQDPYYEHLACVHFDGSDFRLVTSEDGMHTWKFSPDRRYIIDTWSRVDLLPHTAVVEVATSKQVAFLQKEVVDSQLAGKYVPPERFTAKGRDGETDIYGVIVRPHNMDETKKYPVIEVIYAHPFQYFTPKRFASTGGSRRRAGLRYVVVVIDGMGTNGRSKAFRDVAYKNLNDAGFPDRIKWMQTAASTRSWMDVASRVGITGGSAGGQNAAAAVLHHHDFYKAAVALSGSHDNRMSDGKWAEMYMGWPVDESYERNSNCANAGKLGGALMLVTGEVDNVVDPSTTMRMASALIDADKDFDLVVIPKHGHYMNGVEWLARKEAQFWARHLLN